MTTISIPIIYKHSTEKRKNKKQKDTKGGLTAYKLDSPRNIKLRLIYQGRLIEFKSISHCGVDPTLLLPIGSRGRHCKPHYKHWYRVTWWIGVLSIIIINLMDKILIIIRRMKVRTDILNEF